MHSEQHPDPKIGWTAQQYVHGIMALQDWLRTPAGEYVRTWEQRMLDAAVVNIFGFNALQLGMASCNGLDALRTNRMPFAIYADLPEAAGNLALPDARSVAVLTQFEELPFASQSLDLVVLPHVLEFAREPHQVLREVERVLIPEGQIVITGFNPLSLWGIRQSWGRRWGQPFLPAAIRMIGVPRIKDWLKLLDFEIEQGWYGCYRPACRSEKWLARMAFMEKAGDRWWGYCGATYMLTAVKRVRGMRLIGLAWKERKARARAAAIATQQEALRK